MNFPSKIYQAWEKDALWQLKGKKQFKGEVIITYVFYVGDRRKRDLDNMIASVNDVLVKADIIEDDSWQLLEIGGAVGTYDKKNPKVEIYIESKGKEVA